VDQTDSGGITMCTRDRKIREQTAALLDLVDSDELAQRNGMIRRAYGSLLLMAFVGGFTGLLLAQPEE